jgi:hypothetical protein
MIIASCRVGLPQRSLYSSRVLSIKSVRIKRELYSLILLFFFISATFVLDGNLKLARRILLYIGLRNIKTAEEAVYNVSD